MTIFVLPSLDNGCSSFSSSLSFDSCLSSPSMADEVNADFLQAASYGATGTPTFFIGNEKNGFIKIVGAQPYAAFQAAIDAQLG